MQIKNGYFLCLFCFLLDYQLNYSYLGFFSLRLLD